MSVQVEDLGKDRVTTRSETKRRAESNPDLGLEVNLNNNDDNDVFEDSVEASPSMSNASVLSAILDTMKELVKTNSAISLQKDVKTHTWKVSFSGDPKEDIFDFILNLNDIQESKGLSDGSMLKALPNVLYGKAKRWFRTNRFTTYRDVLEGLREEYVKSNYQRLLKEEIRLKTQGSREPIGEFISGLRTLFSRVIPPLSEQEKLNIIVDNLHPNYGRKIHYDNVSSIEDVLAKGRRIEAINSKLAMYKPPRKAEECLQPSLAWTGDRKSLLTKNIKSVVATSTFACFNCKDPSHGFNDCPKPRTGKFCYRCGLEDVTMDDCRHCKDSSKSKQSSNFPPRKSNSRGNKSSFKRKTVSTQFDSEN